MFYPDLDPRQFIMPTESGLIQGEATYMETRIVPGTAEALSGNMTGKYDIISINLPESATLEYRDAYMQRESTMAHRRQLELQRLLGVKSVIMPIPDTKLGNEARVIIASEHDLGTGRPTADGVISNLRGVSIQFNPADCPVASFVMYKDGKVVYIAQLHTGWRSIVNGIGPAFLQAFDQLGINPEDVYVYVSAFAQEGSYVFGDFLTTIQNAMPDDYITYKDEGGKKWGALDMGAYTYDFLTFVMGIPADNIVMSSVDSVTSREHYSNSAARELGQNNGRNAVTIGLPE